MRGRTVIYFAAVDWAFRMQHHQFISRELARAGARVIYVENTGVRWPGRHDVARVRSRLANLVRTTMSPPRETEAGITVLTPRVLPIHPSKMVRSFNRHSLLRQIRTIAPDLSGDRTIAWIGLPNWTSLDVARALRPALIAYYNADRFSRVPGVHPSMLASEPAVIREADLVFVTSAALAELCEAEGKQPVVVPVGVDIPAFAQAAYGQLARPSDLMDLPGRLIGYVGGITHKLDPGLLEAVAEAFPRDTLVIVGAVYDPGYLPRPLSNVRLLGERPHSSVPGYLQYFDVCLIPYARTEFTGSVYPAKLNEYLAAGRPVVSTDLPEVRPFNHVVRLAGTHAEFVERVREALAEPHDLATASLRLDVAAKSSYPVIVDGMLAELRARLGVQE